jgi:hypothetical protein
VGRGRKRRNGRHSQCQIHHAEELCVLDDNTVSETLYLNQISHDIIQFPKISSSIIQKKICRKCGYILWYVLALSAHYCLYPVMHIQLLVVKFSSYSEIWCSYSTKVWHSLLGCVIMEFRAFLYWRQRQNIFAKHWYPFTKLMMMFLNTILE